MTDKELKKLVASLEVSQKKGGINPDAINRAYMSLYERSLIL